MIPSVEPGNELAQRPMSWVSAADHVKNLTERLTSHSPLDAAEQRGKGTVGNVTKSTLHSISVIQVVT